MKLSTFLQMTMPYFGADKNEAQYTLEVFDWILKDGSYSPLTESEESSLYKLFSGKRNLSAKNARKIIENLSIDHFNESVPSISKDSLMSLQKALSMHGVELVNNDTVLTCAVLLESIIKDCATKERQPRDKSCNTINSVYNYFSKAMKDCDIKSFIGEINTSKQFRAKWILGNCEEFITTIKDNEWRPYTIQGKVCTAEILNAIDEFTDALDQYTKYVILNMDEYENQHGVYYYVPKRIKAIENVPPKSDKRSEDDMDEYFDRLLKSKQEVKSLEEFQDEFQDVSQTESKEEAIRAAEFKADGERHSKFCEQVDIERMELLSLLFEIDRIAANSQ